MRWCRAQGGSLRSWVLIALGLFAVACGKDALVGGSCRRGLTECNHRCVDLEQDPANCGLCGRTCASGLTCSAGTCGSAEAAADVGRDGWDPDVDERDINVSDGLRPDVTEGDVTISDGGSDDNRTPDGSTCTPPYDTPEHCGDCATRCVEPAPLCGLQGTFKCVARCDPPLVACGAICVNTASDEENCGTCGSVCPSGICQAGDCVGKGYGHEVVIGTDYADATLSESSAQVTMLGNAIFQGVGATVRVLTYDEFADAATVTRIERWLLTMAAARGKSVTLSKAAGWSTVPQQLTVQQYQAFLVYDQSLAPGSQMATTGTLWNAAMNAFAKGGGIIVALDGGSAGQMKDLLNNGGLLAVTGETDVTGTQLNVAAPTDVVGQNLPNVFAAKKTTVAFTTTQMRDNYHVFVVTDSTGMLPIVVHSVPAP